MLAQLDQIEASALAALQAVADEASLEGWRVAYLGRSSPLMGVFDQLGSLTKEERPQIGRRANEVKRLLEALPGSSQPRSCARRPWRAPCKPSGWMSPCRADRAARPPAPGHADPAPDLPHLCRDGFPGLPLARSGDG